MSDRHQRAVGTAWLAPLLALVTSPLVGRAAEDFSLSAFLHEQPGVVARVLQDPERYRVQVIYSRIDRDADGVASLRTHYYRAGAEYFYPASTVKLPVAVLALEQVAHAPAVDAHTPMFTVPAGPRLPGAVVDPAAPDGIPSVAQYVREIFLVSDNDAFNRLYELVGQDAINETLRARAYAGVRIVHRLSVALSPAENRRANAVRFLHPRSGDLLWEVPQREAQGLWWDRGREIPLGVAEIVDGERVPGAKDFASKNALPLQALHDMVQALMVPQSLPAERRFGLSDDDLALVRHAMALTPAASGIEAYAELQDDYVKFLLPSGDQARPQLRVFNKVGQAYGFLTDAAYVIDFERGIEFLLAATVYVNDNGTFNDDQYEYDELGFPFLRALGEAVYAEDVQRARSTPVRRPALRALLFDPAP